MRERGVGTQKRRAGAREEKRESAPMVRANEICIGFTLSRLVLSVTRVVIRVSHAFCSTGQEKRKTTRSLYPAILTKLAWSIKDLSFGPKEAFSCETTAGNPAQATEDGPILPTRVANQNIGFSCILLLTNLATK